jgi:hypothetical protein
MSCGRISKKSRSIININPCIISAIAQVKSDIQTTRKRNISTAIQIIPTLVHRCSPGSDRIIKADIGNVISLIKRTLRTNRRRKSGRSSRTAAGTGRRTAGRRTARTGRSSARITAAARTARRAGTAREQDFKIGRSRICNKSGRIIGVNYRVIHAITQIKGDIKAAGKRNIGIAVQVIPTPINQRSPVKNSIIQTDVSSIIGLIQRALYRDIRRKSRRSGRGGSHHGKITIDKVHTIVAAVISPASQIITANRKTRRIKRQVIEGPITGSGMIRPIELERSR